MYGRSNVPFTPADSSYLNRHVKLYHNNNKNKRQNEKHSRRPKVAAMEENIAIFRLYIVYRRVSTRYFMEKYRSGDISGFIAIYRWVGDISAIFLQYIAWSTRVNESQTRYSTRQRATVMLQCAFYNASTFVCCWEDLNLKPKGLGFTYLPSELTCPLIYNVQ